MTTNSPDPASPTLGALQLRFLDLVRDLRAIAVPWEGVETQWRAQQFDVDARKRKSIDLELQRRMDRAPSHREVERQKCAELHRFGNELLGIAQRLGVDVPLTTDAVNSLLDPGVPRWAKQSSIVKHAQTMKDLRREMAMITNAELRVESAKRSEMKSQTLLTPNQLPSSSPTLTVELAHHADMVLSLTLEKLLLAAVGSGATSEKPIKAEQLCRKALRKDANSGKGPLSRLVKLGLLRSRGAKGGRPGYWPTEAGKAKARAVRSG